MTDRLPPGRTVFGAVDRYITGLFKLHDAALDAALLNAADAGLPAIEISAAQGRFLQILALVVGARRILEIGALGGYSTIWLGRALEPGGLLISLEIDPVRAGIARSNIARAGLSGLVEVRAGPAIESLQQMIKTEEAPFDLVFVDADEPSYIDYLDAVLRLARPGTLIVADNIIREGEVADSATVNPRAVGARRFLEALARESRVEATVVPLVGEGSYDGMAIAVVKRVQAGAFDGPNNR